MMFLAIVCFCIAAYFSFPLPSRNTSKVASDELSEKFQTPLEARPATCSEILHSLEVIRLGISSGMTISDALEYATQHSTRTAAEELELGLAQFRVGFSLAHGLEQIAVLNQGWRSITDTLIASVNSGSSISDHLADVEFVLQSSLDTEKLKRIKSVAVKSVLPLGLCFLPAFILLTVVPIVAGFIGGITQ